MLKLLLTIATVGLLLAGCESGQRIAIFSTVMNDNLDVEPFAIAPDLFYVGSSDIAVFALRTSKGIVLIDGGYEATGKRVPRKLRQLGLDPHDIVLLLNTHAHFDHAAGLASLQAINHATLQASEQDAPLLASGGQDDFAFGDWLTFPKVNVDDDLLSDGEEVDVGDYTLTAHITAGHTKGCTTWSFRIEVDDEMRDAVVFCSLSVQLYHRFGDDEYPQMEADFAAAYRTASRLPCELFLANHAHFFGLAEKRDELLEGAHRNPFLDAVGCRSYLADEVARFQRRGGRLSLAPEEASPTALSTPAPGSPRVRPAPPR